MRVRQTERQRVKEREKECIATSLLQLLVLRCYTKKKNVKNHIIPCHCLFTFYSFLHNFSSSFPFLQPNLLGLYAWHLLVCFFFVVRFFMPSTNNLLLREVITRCNVCAYVVTFHSFISSAPNACDRCVVCCFRLVFAPFSLPRGAIFR